MKIKSIPYYITNNALDQFIKSALEEDLGDGDHSSLASIEIDQINTAHLLVKEDCIIAGVELAEYIFKYYDSSIVFKKNINDGAICKKGEIAFTVEGKAQSILSTERLVLNCMQRMSGIATLTNEMVNQIIEFPAKILDTRKTTPNFRLCEKWAVFIGGGNNHRFGLYDMVMLKDNHIDYCGGIKNAVDKTKSYLNKNNLSLKIVVETRNIKEVKQALSCNVDRILLDNMSISDMKKSVEIINGKTQTEASGGITKNQLKSIAMTGVDFISMGALTHSAKNIDLSLKAKDY